jgi:ubiquinone/menaquinone biosynthesis C-methylase UbiE
MNANEVKQVWDSRATDPSFTKETITFNDYWYRLLEVDAILDYVKSHSQFSSVLDVGCGNGYTTAAISPWVGTIHGVDYSEAMIKKAEADYGHGFLENITWGTTDILNMAVSTNYDLVLTSRCLINLVSWNDQMKALDNIANAVRPNGIYMMVECSIQGRDHLNNLRETMGLARIPTIPFNLDFNEDELWPYLSKYFTIYSVTRFGLYEFISKILHPLYVSPEEPKYDHKLNEIASNLCKQIPALGSEIDKCSHEFLAILIRKQ